MKLQNRNTFSFQSFWDLELWVCTSYYRQVPALYLQSWVLDPYRLMYTSILHIRAPPYHPWQKGLWGALRWRTCRWGHADCLRVPSKITRDLVGEKQECPSQERRGHNRKQMSEVDWKMLHCWPWSWRVRDTRHMCSLGAGKAEEMTLPWSLRKGHNVADTLTGPCKTSVTFLASKTVN